MPFKELSDEERCHAVSKHTKQRCRNPHMVGLTVCEKHGGLTPAAKAKSDLAKAERYISGKMARFVTPIDANDIEADPVFAFEMEFRRTVARIRYLDECIAELTDNEALVWGKTKTEQIGASEFEGENITYESRMNAYVALQWQERKHLVELEKVWIGAKLDSKRLEIQARYVEMLDAAIVRILTRLGQNVLDPALRDVVRQELAAIPAK